MDYAALWEEINQDPIRLGYRKPDGEFKKDKEIADLLNIPTQQADRPSISAAELFEATVLKDWEKLKDEQQVLYSVLIALDEINLAGKNTRAVLLDLFDDKTDTYDNLVALQAFACSRAKVLGLGRVKAGHVQKARAMFGGE